MLPAYEPVYQSFNHQYNREGKKKRSKLFKHPCRLYYFSYFVDVENHLANVEALKSMTEKNYMVAIHTPSHMGKPTWTISGYVQFLEKKNKTQTIEKLLETGDIKHIFLRQITDPHMDAIKFHEESPDRCVMEGLVDVNRKRERQPNYRTTESYREWKKLTIEEELLKNPTKPLKYCYNKSHDTMYLELCADKGAEDVLEEMRQVNAELRKGASLQVLEMLSQLFESETEIDEPNNKKSRN